MPRGARKRLARSIYQDQYGISGVVRVGAHTEEIRFPLGTPIPEIRAELERRSDELTDDAPAKAEAGTLAAIVARILARETRPAAKTNAAQLLTPWTVALGPHAWHRLTRADLTRVVSDWQVAGLSAARCRKRITRLRTGWRAIAPDRALPHAIERIPLPPEPKPTVIRARPMWLIEQVLDHLPETSSSAKTHGQPSKSRALLGLMAWTGQPPARLGAVRSTHVRWASDPPELYVSPRRKGAGSDDAWLPLLPQAVPWLRAFLKAGGAPASMRPVQTAWARAIARTQAALREAGQHDDAAQLEGFRVYDLRHSFLTYLAIQTGDVYVVQQYAGHASLQTTLRYMRGAANVRVKSAIVGLANSATI